MNAKCGRRLAGQVAAFGFLCLMLGGARPAHHDEPREAVSLKPATYAEYEQRLKLNAPGVKLILVDAWATYCPPCKENFPHLVEMHHKYAAHGLRVISMSFDDPEDEKALAQARKFLDEKQAVIENYYLNEEAGLAYEKFDINAIPAVFLYTPDGVEVQRFTLDNPQVQFTYAQVEEAVKAKLGLTNTR